MTMHSQVLPFPNRSVRKHKVTATAACPAEMSHASASALENEVSHGAAKAASNTHSVRHEYLNEAHHVLENATATLQALGKMIRTEQELHLLAELYKEFGTYILAFKKVVEASKQADTARTQVPAAHLELMQQSDHLKSAVSALQNRFHAASDILISVKRK